MNKHFTYVLPSSFVLISSTRLYSMFTHPMPFCIKGARVLSLCSCRRLSVINYAFNYKIIEYAC